MHLSLQSTWRQDRLRRPMLPAVPLKSAAGMAWVLILLPLMIRGLRLFLELTQTPTSSWMLLIFFRVFESLILVLLILGGWHAYAWWHKRRTGSLPALGHPGRIFILVALLVAIVIHFWPRDRVLYRPGVFLIQGGRYLFTMGSFADNMVHYTVEDWWGRPLITSQERAAVGQRWYAYWEASTASLWVYSSDIGALVWVKDGEGYQSHWLTPSNSALRARMPAPFRQELPSSF